MKPSNQALTSSRVSAGAAAPAGGVATPVGAGCAGTGAVGTGGAGPRAAAGAARTMANRPASIIDSERIGSSPLPRNGPFVLVRSGPASYGDPRGPPNILIWR